MRDEYSANPSDRPRLICAAEDGEGGEALPDRRFLCGACRSAALICSFCDRGQIYCGAGCARRARQCSLRDAGRRYRASHQGRRNQARRTARWRDRQKNVTHHGSPPPSADDLLPSGAPVVAREARAQGKSAESHWAHMTVHGVLHLLGFDHERDAEARKMAAQEIQILDRLGFSNPYA